ncbi:hypothetical protein Patl1_05934 [Pistacia atlantica]|uniref:Uncharacterized protein n=1 Tax=Pistacia atlantica TaxID=434234 RepID=A0ACC1BNW2_9ROSI|nr:hypothetical protein Patl1_05934 [Pistacia atlantica]
MIIIHQKLQLLGNHLIQGYLCCWNISGNSTNEKETCSGKYFQEFITSLSNFFKKIDELLSQVKSHNQMRGVRTMQRSLSVGSPRSRAIDGDKSPLRLDRFKIRTVVLDGGGQGSGQDGGQPSVPSQVLQNRNLSIFPSRLGCLRLKFFYGEFRCLSIFPILIMLRTLLTQECEHDLQRIRHYYGDELPLTFYV